MSYEDVEIKTPEYVSLQFQSANIGSRAIALIIDNLIIFAIQFFVLIGAVWAVGGFRSVLTLTNSAFMLIAIVVIIFFIINYGYFILFEYFNTGQTPGKRVVGIRVIQDNGHSITFLTSIIRNLLRLIDSLPTGYLLGIILVFTHPQNKRLGDILAGTIVVHERSSKSRKTKLERHIELRSLPLPNIAIHDIARRSVKAEEWKLLKTYSERFMFVTESERDSLTRQLAEVLLPKFDISPQGKTIVELEDILLSLYLILKEDWDYMN